MSWQSAPLGELADVQLGKMLDQKKNQGEYRRYLGNDNVQWNELKLDEVKEMRIKDSEQERFRLRSNDLLICEGGDPGRCALWTSEKEMYYQKALNRVRVGRELDARYLLYYFLHIGATREITQYYTGGATIKHLPNAALKRVEVRYPDLQKQRRIAAVLMAYDNLIESNRRQIKLLEEAAQRLYREWFIDLNFPGHEDAEIVDGIPKGWELTRLSEIADVVMGQSPKSEFYNYRGEGLPFHQGVSSYGARFVNDDTYTTSFTRIAEAGSILFSVRAPVGRLNLTDHKIVLGRGLAAINHKTGLQSWLFYLLKERFFKDDIVGNGSIFSSITKEELLSQSFVAPSSHLSERFNALCVPLDKKIKNCNQAIDAAQEARDRLLPKLMSGEIEA